MSTCLLWIKRQTVIAVNTLLVVVLDYTSHQRCIHVIIILWHDLIFNDTLRQLGKLASLPVVLHIKLIKVFEFFFEACLTKESFDLS